jgi:ankyrin repeat protein
MMVLIGISSSPLHKAAFTGREMAMRYLIKKGAKADAKDNEGATPLHKAAFSGEVKAVTLVRQIYSPDLSFFANLVLQLISKGANVNEKDEQGSTPLHNAAFRGNVDCVTALVERSAVVDTNDINGLRYVRDTSIVVVGI